jgi:hypothetical protein
MTIPSLPTARAIAAVLESLGPHAGESELVAAPSAAFPLPAFTAATLDDPYWRDTLEVVGADGARLGDSREFVEREVAAAAAIQNLWERLRASGHRLVEWRGHCVYALAPTGPGVDFLQLALDHEGEITCSKAVAAVLDNRIDSGAPAVRPRRRTLS